jgi:hypothetical protein
MRFLFLFLFIFIASARFTEQVVCEVHANETSDKIQVAAWRIGEQLDACFGDIESCETLTIILHGDFKLRTLLLGDVADKVIIKGRGSLLEGGGMILSKRVQSITFYNVGFTGADTPIFASSAMCTSVSVDASTFSGFTNTAIIDLKATCSVVDVSFNNVLFLMNTNATIDLHGVRSWKQKNIHNEKQITWRVTLAGKSEL